MFVDTFIRRPILATVCSLVIILAGVLAIPQMPIAQYPQIAPPTVNVTAIYTGANAETVETAVTTPLEQAINGVEGMLYMTAPLKRVPGVPDIFIFGAGNYSMRVWLDPVRLAARHLTASDVVNALREQNVNVAAGSVGDAPAPEGQTYQLSVRAAGRLHERSEFENIIVKSGEGGALVRLADVARVELGAESYGSVLRFQGRDAVGFGVIALPTANALDVNRGVMAELTRLSRSFPPGLKYAVAFDTTTVVQESLNEVLKTLAI